MPVDHEFGDQHTELKLSIVEKYLKAFSTALRGKFEELWYIDAFAGTGSRTVRHEPRPADLIDPAEPERIERRRGSASIAIDVAPPFDFIVFIENKPSYVAALEDLAARYPGRRIAVVKNDANDALKSLIAANNWRSTRAVLFLDPYGMQLEWATLEKVAQTRAIDVWFLFSLSGLYRQATRELTDIDQHKRAALTRMFGSDAWEAELYPKSVRDDLFGQIDEPRRRTVMLPALKNTLGHDFRPFLAPCLNLSRCLGTKNHNDFPYSFASLARSGRPSAWQAKSEVRYLRKAYHHRSGR